MEQRPTSTAVECHRFTGLFEAELLATLMLHRWGHPSADDTTFVRELVEAAREVLRQSIDGAVLLEDVKPPDMSFVAAVWYVEWFAISNTPSIDPDNRRWAWVDAVRHALPSCFCDPADLV